MFGTAVSILIPIYNRHVDVLLLGKKGDFSIMQIGIGSTKLDVLNKYDGMYFCGAISQKKM